MRVKYIDNIRVVCILMLFPFHTGMIYNNWGEMFYIKGTPLLLPSLFNKALYPWWMTLLFTLAGISSFYALRKRSSKEYVRERIEKLLIPLLIGFVLILPVQSYIADLFYNGYSGGYFAHYKIFFTRFTYLTGQDGGFTPGHLWFILYLFIISMSMLPVMNWYLRREKRLDGSKITIAHLLPLFLVILIMTPLLDIAGKSIGEMLACFAIGFFLLSIEEVQKTIVKSRRLIAVLFSIALLFRMVSPLLPNAPDLFWDTDQRAVTWFGILTVIGCGKAYFNKSGKLMEYLSGAAFSLYYFHQSIVVIVGFFVLKYIKVEWLQFLIIMIISLGLSLICYEIFRRNRITAFLFGIKYKNISINR